MAVLMSLHLEFTPHSWYKGAAIEYRPSFPRAIAWTAYIEDGMYTYSVIELCAGTLKELKMKITNYRNK